MWRHAAIVVVMAGLVWVGTACLLAFPASAIGAADERITRYQVDLTIGRDGVLHIKETISYDFGAADKHGIYRYVPRKARDTAGGNRLYDLADVRVSTPDGAAPPFQVTRDDDETEIRIGDPAQTVRGRHVYVIDYTVPAALTSYDDHDELFWDAIGDGWRTPISDVAVSVTLPVPITGTTCVAGSAGERVKCRSAATRGAVARFGHPSLAPGTPLTVLVKWRKGAITVPEPEYESFWGPLSPLAIIVGPCLLLVPLVLLAQGLPLGRARPVLADAPPPDVRPGEVGVLKNGKTRTLDITATLVDLARRGHLRILDDHGHFTLIRTGSLDSPGLARYESTLLKGLFSGVDEVIVKRSRLWVMPVLKRTRQQIVDETVERGWFRRHPVRRRTWQARLAVVMIVATPVALAGMVLSPMRASDAWFIAAFLGGAGVLAYILIGYVRPLTRDGLQIVGRLEGLREHIKKGPVPDASTGETARAAALLPYAAVFGSAYAYGNALFALEGKPPDWYEMASGEDSDYNLGAFVSAIRLSYGPVGGEGSGSSGGDGGGHGSGGSGGGGGESGGGGGGGSW